MRSSTSIRSRDRGMMLLQQVKSNRDSCLRLARRATVFVLNIRDTMEGKWDFAPPSLKESVDRFEW
jgi:hypothetical protein